MAGKTSKTATVKTAAKAATKEIRNEKYPANRLTVDHRVQREHINKEKLGRIRSKWDLSFLNMFVVSERDNGDLVIVDGQHRWLLVQEIEGKEFEVDCRVHTGLTLAEEADLFIHLNQQEPASPLDLHKARITKKEPIALALEEAAAKNDWEIGTGKGRISAIKALEELYYLGEGTFEDFGPELVQSTLFVVTQAWGHDKPQAVSRYVLLAVGEFLHVVEKWIDQEGKPSDFFNYSHFATNIQKEYKAGPKGWMQGCRGIVDSTEFNLKQAQRLSLHNVYQKGLPKSKKLPDSLREVAKKKRQT